MSGRLLAITGGHRFDDAAFSTLVGHIADTLGWSAVHMTQPDAMAEMRPERAQRWSAVLLHDLPGLRLARGTEPELVGPTDDERIALTELIASGVGIVATHHALAGWPAWDGWADVLGGRFLYAPGQLHGTSVPASGYRMDTYRVVPVAAHPVCAGVEPFELTDELYLCPVFEHDVVPLLATDSDVSAATMIDTYREVRHGEQVRAHDQPGSRLLGWATTPGESRVVYLLPGHTPATMQHPMYRRLLTNALGWVAERQPTSA